MNERFYGTFLSMRRPNFKPFGWELYFYKVEDNKTLVIDHESIKWIEVQPYATPKECLFINDIDHIEPFKNEAKHEGKIEAMQKEIDFLRGELSKALERAAK